MSRPRTAFLDFEASSLGKKSTPIEVAWVFEDGAGESHLIRPAPDWTDWAESAQAIHGIARERLTAEGTPHDRVARRMVEQLTHCALYATAPSWDGKWLSVLLRAAGLPRHALRLEDTTVAHRRVALVVFAAAGVAADRSDALLGGVLKEAERHFAVNHRPAHRAADDARLEWERWRTVRRLAEQAAAGDPAEE